MALGQGAAPCHGGGAGRAVGTDGVGRSEPSPGFGGAGPGVGLHLAAPGERDPGPGPRPPYDARVRQLPWGLRAPDRPAQRGLCGTRRVGERGRTGAAPRITCCTAVGDPGSGSPRVLGDGHRRAHRADAAGCARHCPSAPRVGLQGAASGGGAPAGLGRAAVRGGHGLAGARDRYRLHRPGAPGGAAAVGRGGIAAGGAGRSPGGRATPRCHLPGGADPPGGRRRRRRGDAGRDDRAHRPGDQRAGRPGPADSRRGEHGGPDGRWLVRHRHAGGALRLTAASGLRVGADAAVRRLLLGGPVRLLAEDRVGPRHRPAQRQAECAAAGRDVVGHDPGPGHVPGGAA